jgi:NAD(P)-dependent dehydrogenase (short-subunit alcohol dehydrogenase family)
VVRRLEGKVAVITGAARGQGRATAIRMAEEGCAVAVTDIDAAGLAGTADAVMALGGGVVSYAGDITQPETIETLVELAVDRLGRIDVLHNNAGILGAGPLELCDLAAFDRVMHVNCYAQLLAIQRVLPEMRRAGGGSIINVSSIGGLVALPQLSVYCASKAAVIGLTRAVAYEVAADGIRCNVICPGGVDTPMADAALASFEDRDQALELLTGRQMFKRFAQPGEIAELVVFLASDASSFMTGATVPIEAGHSAW